MAKSRQEITSPEPAPEAEEAAGGPVSGPFAPPTETEIYAAFIVEHCKRALAQRTTPAPIRAFIDALMTLPPAEFALVLSSFTMLRIPMPAPPDPPLPPAPEEDPRTAAAAAARAYDALLEDAGLTS